MSAGRRDLDKLFQYFITFLKDSYTSLVLPATCFSSVHQVEQNILKKRPVPGRECDKQFTSSFSLAPTCAKENRRINFCE